MFTNRLVLLIVLYRLVKDGDSQKILSFKGFVHNSSCTQPKVAREFLDKFYIQAELDTGGVSLREWWTFALVSPRGITEELVATMKLDKCKATSQPNLDEAGGSDIICWKNGGIMNVLFAIEVNPVHNGTKFRGIWSNLNSGSLQTRPPDIKLTVVGAEDEVLNINGVIVSFDSPLLPFPLDSTAHIKYCMYNIDTHELSIKIDDQVVNSTSDCATLDVFIGNADVGKKVTFGIRETAGACRRVSYREFVIVEDGFEMDKMTLGRSINVSTKTCVKSLGVLLLLASFCTLCLLTLG